METSYLGTAPPPRTCPNCGHNLEEVTQVRVTEATEAKAEKKPYGNVEYADPGLQSDGKARYPIDTEDHVRAAWSYVNQEKNAAKYSAADLKKVKARIKAAMKKFDIPVSENSISEAATEALINGKRSFDDLRELVRKAVRTRLSNEMDAYCWVYIVDISDTDVVYMAEGDKLYQCTWSLSGDDVELGEAVAVERTYAPLQGDDMEEETATEAVTETRAQVDVNGARIIEAKGTDEKGNRIFRVQVIAYGDSKNGRRYPESVMRAAAPLYEGTKAFNRHRTDAEMRSGTIEGLVGYYRNASAGDSGIEADLHVLPSAAAVAEAFDAALALETDEPLIGISHDVYAKFRPVQENGRQIQEATEISSVNSADVVAHPAAGGKATRVVAGGLEDTPADTVSAGESTEESDVPVKREDVLAAISEATDEELVRFGLAKAGTKSTETEKVEETAKPDTPAVKTTEAATLEKGTFLGNLMVKQKVEDAQLPKAVAESIAENLPQQFTEAQVDAQIASFKAVMAIAERAGLEPKAKPEVTKEAIEKKQGALDAFFAKDYTKGYHSFREAFMDFTGRNPRAFDEDFNRVIMRETVGAFDSSFRASESMDTTSWAQALGDSITRRMVAEYAQPSLQSWQAIVSSKVPVNDFRTQRIDRIGGYGTLPTVNQGAPYQPLTSPEDEEVTYALTKRGGTEDITLEMIANDDVRAIQNIPSKLGLAAAQTLFRFVWDFLNTNPNIYDGNALFTVGGAHSNSATNALSQSNLSAARIAMRNQAAYGDTSNILSLVPKILVVVNDLEEIAFQLSNSAVAVPSTPAGPSDTPNLHQNLQAIVVDYWTSTTQWIAVADPKMCPTFELGFYQGRELPELFTQADPNTGSAFSADKVTYKIRHIYSGAVLDYRGFYRGNV